MGTHNSDRQKRKHFRKKVLGWGMDPAEAELCVRQVADRQRLKKLGKLEMDAPICTRAEYIRLLRLQTGSHEHNTPVLNLGKDYEPPDDKGFAPKQVDPVLVGTARATGVAAKAVTRKKTVTKSEYDEMSNG
jgi:hypothetical protein